MSRQFDDAVHAVRANLLALLDASVQLRERHGSMAAADSAAMAELAEEPRYAGTWGQKPVESAHSWAGVLLAGAEDQLRTMCRIVVDEPSLFGPQCLARSALEMAGRAYWLAEQGIGTDRRVSRYETERLYNLSEVRRLKGADAQTTLAMQKITETARRLGLDLLSGKRYHHTHITEERPPGNRVFRSLLQDVKAYELGHTIFAYLSAVDHGTIYGLLQAVGPTATDEAFGPNMRPLCMSAGQTNQLLGVATIGYGYAFARFAQLMGWDDDAWTYGWSNAVRHAFDLLGTLRPQL